MFDTNDSKTRGFQGVVECFHDLAVGDRHPDVPPSRIDGRFADGCQFVADSQRKISAAAFDQFVQLVPDVIVLSGDHTRDAKVAAQCDVNRDAVQFFRSCEFAECVGQFFLTEFAVDVGGFFAPDEMPVAHPIDVARK